MITKIHGIALLAVGLIAGTTSFIVGCQASADSPAPAKKPPAQQKPAKNPYYSRTNTAKLKVSDAEWKKILPPDVYAVAREKNTELPFTGKYNDFTGLGTYYCVVCGNKLFRSDAKFASTCGWPSFYQPSRKGAVIYKSDKSHDMVRDEVLCGRCESHLGHVFDDGPPPTGKRFCMNSIVLDFVPDKPAAPASKPKAK
jgi:peptide-methionine (R)-S-oxide reductase